MAKMTKLSALRVLLFVWLAAELSLANAHVGHSHSGDSEGPGLRDKSLILTKVYALLIVFFATFLGGISPYFFRWNEAFLVLGTQFAGGVFLATAMIHFLGDSHDVFRRLRPTSFYAYSEMLAVVGYLLTMLADVAIQSVHDRKVSTVQGAHDYLSEKRAAADVESPTESSETKAAIQSSYNLSDAVLLIFALCFHSIFEGIAIGVAATKDDTWTSLWTVSLHKVFAAIAMGIALLRMLPNRPLLQCVLYAFAFAISTPIGVAIGIIINSTVEGRIADWIYAVSMGIATGVFVYVAINHLLAKGHKPNKKVALDRPLWRWAAVVLGATLIGIVMIWD
ncbi:zinc transporter 11 [Physcomitrium patens]|uniref:ZIP family transporter n=1 Tax=Physcomitrium patens TaxID=3218 RepID=A9T038_PHYPA|nr:zinc transporter 2-like [Physcomitrium patens]PNR37195.1 hypothetical protein PHYPA_020302 [Physcomitrium patens]|eukprot:XP_024399348.1 zinc transporter 2-like [Physcomitrella patens]